LAEDKCIVDLNLPDLNSWMNQIVNGSKKLAVKILS